VTARLFAAADVHYLPSGGARAAVVLAADVTFSTVLTEQTALVSQVLPYRPGEFFLRELPPLRSVLAGVSGLSLLVIDGYVDLDPAGRPGLGAHVAVGDGPREHLIATRVGQRCVGRAARATGLRR
jgi:deoxyribonuclease V